LQDRNGANGTKIAESDTQPCAFRVKVHGYVSQTAIMKPQPPLADLIGNTGPRSGAEASRHPGPNQRHPLNVMGDHK